MLGQQKLQSSFRLYNCVECKGLAKKPIITRCGHLYCWKCFYENSKKTQKCIICGYQNQLNDIYPVFIDQQNDHQDNSQLEIERPPPRNMPKILNTDMMSRSNFDKNNIAMGRPFAGHLFIPSLAINAYSQIKDGQQNAEEQALSKKLRYLCVLFFIIFALLLSTFMLK